jgi:hypothetical protein
MLFEQPGSSTDPLAFTRSSASPVGPVRAESPGADDLFVHFSAILMSGYRTLDAGQNVEFDVGPGQKGEEAPAPEMDGKPVSARRRLARVVTL